MVDIRTPDHKFNVVCYNGNRQIPTYSVYTIKSYTHGIAFHSAFDMCATHIFHVCHVEVVADLYCINQLSNN